MQRDDALVDGFQHYLKNDAREAFDRVMLKLKADLESAGRSEREATAFAKEQALIHFKNKFQADQKRGAVSSKKHAEESHA